MNGTTIYVEAAALAGGEYWRDIPRNIQEEIVSAIADAQAEPVNGFSREDLVAVAESLEEGYERTVNVGNVTGVGDEHQESTTAYAARFIRSVLATPQPPAGRTPEMNTAVRKVLQHHGLTKHGDGVVEADLIEAVLACVNTPQPPAKQPFRPDWMNYKQGFADGKAEADWVGCGECDCSFPCHNGKKSCLRLPAQDVELSRLARAAREAYFPSSRHGHPSFDKLDPSSVSAWERVAAAVIAAQGGAV